MKRFEFRLERVFKLKKQREWLAELRQKQARLVLDAAEAEVLALQEQLSQTAALLQALMGQPVDLIAWFARYEQSKQIGRFLETAEVKAKEAAQKLEEANAVRTKIATEVEALLYLRRQQWQVYRQEVARTHQEQLDELGLRRWQAGQANDSP